MNFKITKKQAIDALYKLSHFSVVGTLTNLQIRFSSAPQQYNNQMIKYQINVK